MSTAFWPLCVLIVGDLCGDVGRPKLADTVEKLDFDDDGGAAQLAARRG
jgi:hypothetical protein